MSAREGRLKALLDATTKYIDKEKEYIDNEVNTLQDILSGRTGGAGIQQSSTKVLAEVAYNDLASYLAKD